MKNLTSVAFVSMTMLAACGQKNSKSSEQPQTSTTPAAAPAEMGQAAIIAVPVDSSGKENIDGAQMHVLSQAPASIDSSNVAQVFKTGSDANQFVSELDQTSSTESYRGWHNFRIFVSVGGRRGCGYGPQGSMYGYQGYNNYQPTYYYQGSPYAMQYQNSYQNSSMNYYYYNNSQQAGYQGQGQQYPNQQQPNQQYPNQQQPNQYPNQQQPNQPQQPQYPNQQQPNQPQLPQYPNQQQPNQPQQPQYPTPQLPSQPQY